MGRGRIEYFGETGKLLGAFHLASPLQRRSHAVLLCNPFGEEAPRCHRTFRVLATQLERAGFSTLRFDYSGTGDSLGCSARATVAEWIADIGAAAAELCRASGSSRVALVGLRFGATLAMLASARGEVRPRQLVLWDPIVEGGAYLRELDAVHHAYMRDELGTSCRAHSRKPADGMPSEALGAPISAELAREIRSIDLARLTVAVDHVSVVSTRPSPQVAQLQAHLPQARWMQMPETAAWNSDAALNAMVVPMNIVQVLVAQLEEGCGE